MLARVTSTSGLTSLFAIALAGCTATVRSVGVDTNSRNPEGFTVLDETPFTLYAEPSFKLIELPAGQDLSVFWSDFREQAADNSQALSISRVADDRILRVLFKEDGITYAFHLAIYQERKLSGNTVIRLVPISAWKPSFGGGIGVANVRAEDAHALIGQLKARLISSAAPAT